MMAKVPALWYWTSAQSPTVGRSAPDRRSKENCPAVPRHFAGFISLRGSCPCIRGQREPTAQSGRRASVRFVFKPLIKSESFQFHIICYNAYAPCLPKNCSAGQAEFTLLAVLAGYPAPDEVIAPGTLAPIVPASIMVRSHEKIPDQERNAFRQAGSEALKYQAANLHDMPLT